MDEQLKSNLTSSKHWLRLIYMVLFSLFLQVALSIMWVLVVIQFLFALITGNDNKKLRSFGSSLCAYISQAIRFLTYNSEDKPFPFSDWPEASVTEEPEVVESEVVSEEPTTEAQSATLEESSAEEAESNSDKSEK